MKKFKVFRHPSGTLEAVKQGWSWPAFFFSCFWALYKKFWALGVSFLISFMVLGIILCLVATEQTTDTIIRLLGTTVSIIFGACGNTWLEENLGKRGYEKVDTVTAVDREAAVAFHLNTERLKN